MRHERFVAFEGVHPEKALSMRTSQGCPHSQGLHERKRTPLIP